MYCVSCNVQIPLERLEALPSTKHCLNCSDVTKPIGMMVWAHKTAPTLAIIDSNDIESVTKAVRANKRSR